MFFQTKCSRYIPPYDREDKNSGGSIRTNHPANDVLSVLSCHVETVVLLTQKRKSKDYKVEIEIPIDVDGSKTYTEEKSTYQNIKKFIKAKYGVNTHTKDIAEVKRDCGVEMRLNYNISKKENPKIRHCTQEKRGYIMDALEYYQVI